MPESTPESTTHVHSIALSPRIPQVWPRFFVSPTLVGSMALQRRATVPSYSGLLQRWGDRPFSRVLRAQKRQVRKAVIDAITGFGKPTEFPLTYASALH